MSSTTFPNLSSSRSSFRLTVTVVRAFDLPDISTIVHSNRKRKERRFYTVLSVDGNRKKTNVAEPGSAPEWNESFLFEAHHVSILKLDIYADRTVKDTHIGGISKSITALWPSILEGGNYDVTETISEGTNARVELHLEIKVDHPQADIVDIRRVAEDALSNMQSLTTPVGLALKTSASTLQPVQNLADSWTPLLNKIKMFCDLMDGIAEVHPYTKMAWKIVSIPQKIMSAQMDRDDRIHKLFATMNSFYDIVSDLEKRPEMRHTLQDLLQRIAQQTIECFYFIRDYAKTKGFVKRTGQQLFSTTNVKIDTYCTVFVKFKEEFYGRVAVQTLNTVNKTEIVVTHILDDVEDLAIDINLDDMPYANDANFDEAKGCQPGTRVGILEEIADWVNNQDAPRILLLSGAAGTGKSSIAHTIAHRFQNMNRLGSSFCFVRGQMDRGPGKLFPTVARDLADFDKGIRRALHEVVKDNKALRVTSKVTQQFDNLILKPVARFTMAGPLVIVIDALDESGDARAREDLLRELASKTNALPSNFRILLTSRPEPDIMRAFQACDHVIFKSMHDLLPSSTEDDIRLYIHDRLCSPEVDDIDEGCMRMLVSRCEGLFQWASVACKFIKGVGMPGSAPRERYDLLVQGTTREAWRLDDLYRAVLSHFFRPRDSFVMARFKLVMALVLTTFEPLSVESLNGILHAVKEGNPGFKANVILDYMGSLLSGATGTDTVRPLHTSFREFLLDRDRSVDYYIDTSHTHSELTLASLYILKEDLTFNICHLESSHAANKDIPGLADRIKECIPVHLSYSCRFWTNHLQAIAASSAFDSQLLEDVEVVLTDKLLFWLEAMSLLGAIHGAAKAMSSLVKWSLSLKSEQIYKLASGAHAFVNGFGFPMSQSTPHVYLSGLAFAPRRSTVFERFEKDFPQVLKVSAGANDYWPAAQHSIHAGSGVLCVAISPDGSWILSGLDDSTIRVWDVSTGDAVGDPLKGHTDSVNSVAFSLDGLRIVSGSSDHTIRVWNAATHAAVGDPLEGHTGAVKSVTFSSDGLRIVSGSSDSTIRVWDIETCTAVGDPLEGHTGPVTSVSISRDGKWIVSGSYNDPIRVWDMVTHASVGDPLELDISAVYSVAFSADGSRIVSGSWDSTIRVCDTATRAAVGGPLEGHTGLVSSVAVSPDGLRIVSGSHDNTIRVWDAATRTALGDPLEGHTQWVTSVAFSPDGKRIVSGSQDNTIRVWDAATRAALGDPLEGHVGAVNSVAFSPNEKLIVSGSSDMTLRVWNPVTHGPVGGPLEGHRDWVRSVAFSPDGLQIVSGSSDNTIRVWNTATHAGVGDPLEGHTGRIGSVAFSPDGTRIVSGSDDNTIRVWDAATRTALGGPLEGHTRWVTSVAFSPDGLQIVSGSQDNTIRVWDMATHAAVGDPLEGHAGRVFSVAFSPDGKRIVSGSSDSTIRVWDTERHAPVGDPLKGHTYSVTSVAFSPDGKRIVSGSWDNTIRVWDSVTHAAVGDPLEGHTSWIQSVAFSPDGLQIVSGSMDNTIRVWDSPMVQLVSTNEVDGAQVTLHSATSNTPPTTQSELPGMYPPLILISRHLQHAMRQRGLNKSVAPPEWNNRTYKHMNSDGWIVGPASELLFWVPAAYRNKLWPDTRLQFVIGKQLVQLDLSQFVHGTSWHECYRPS